MANVFTLSEVQAFIPGKTWNDLPSDMQDSATVYLTIQQDQPNADERLLGYWLIVPPLRVDELAALIEDKVCQTSTVLLNDGDLVTSLAELADLEDLGYAHEFLSGLIIRFVDDSDFIPDTSGI